MLPHLLSYLSYLQPRLQEFRRCTPVSILTLISPSVHELSTSIRGLVCLGSVVSVSRERAFLVHHGHHGRASNYDGSSFSLPRYQPCLPGHFLLYLFPPYPRAFPALCFVLYKLSRILPLQP